METLRGNGIIGVLRETKSSWERRAPLTPFQMKAIMERTAKIGTPVRFIVQPSARRAFNDQDYAECGAEVREDLTEAHFIIGVKEPSTESLLQFRNYMFFSHTCKAQLYNMPLLDACLARSIRLFDVECIREAGHRHGKRLVGFGDIAGVAGMLDYLWGLGQRLLLLGYSTPFLLIGPAHTYHSVAEAEAVVKRAGEEICRYGLAPQLTPFIFAFTGTGKVSSGAQQIFKCLPHLMVTVEHLPHLFSENCTAREDGVACAFQSPRTNHCLFGCIARLEDYTELKTKQPEGFDKYHYYNNPDLYECNFQDKVLRHCSVMVNGIYWEPKFERLVSNRWLRKLKDTQRSRCLIEGEPYCQLRPIGILDITCDLDGSIECVQQPTAHENPFFTFNPTTGSRMEGVHGEGLLVLAVDELPAEMPIEATTRFGNLLTPFIPHMANHDGSQPHISPKVYSSSSADATKISDRPPDELLGAVITADGKLTPIFEYINELREANQRMADFRAQLKSASVHSSVEKVKVVDLFGHLFDSKFINKAFDLMEKWELEFKLLDCAIGRSTEIPSTASVRVAARSEAALDGLMEELGKMCHQSCYSDSGISLVPQTPASSPLLSSRGIPPSFGLKRIIVCGAGKTVTAFSCHGFTTDEITCTVYCWSRDGRSANDSIPSITQSLSPSSLQCDKA
eukprot:GHVN01051860.1.p1 GENE.GHVN01051860.1~~GHVN01051860.1.p1  ORF type:complete len:680 (+),score=68.51 GHVN01051860.1:85-2124(+)